MHRKGIFWNAAHKILVYSLVVCQKLTVTCQLQQNKAKHKHSKSDISNQTFAFSDSAHLPCSFFCFSILFKSSKDRKRGKCIYILIFVSALRLKEKNVCSNATCWANQCMQIDIQERKRDHFRGEVELWLMWTRLLICIEFEELQKAMQIMSSSARR